MAVGGGSFRLLAKGMKTGKTVAKVFQFVCVLHGVENLVFLPFGNRKQLKMIIPCVVFCLGVFQFCRFQLLWTIFSHHSTDRSAEVQTKMSFPGAQIAESRDAGVNSITHYGTMDRSRNHNNGTEPAKTRDCPAERLTNEKIIYINGAIQPLHSKTRARVCVFVILYHYSYCSATRSL